MLFVFCCVNDPSAGSPTEQLFALSIIPETLHFHAETRLYLTPSGIQRELQILFFELQHEAMTGTHMGDQDEPMHKLEQQCALLPRGLHLV